jgi:hypothetical protein
VRFNPGLGSGGTGKTNVGGPGSSFGTWHELLPEVQVSPPPAHLQGCKEAPARALPSPVRWARHNFSG